jgi:hypothetical protein
MMILLNSLKPSPKLIHRRIQSSKFLRNNEIRENPGDGDGGGGVGARAREKGYVSNESSSPAYGRF